MPPYKFFPSVLRILISSIITYIPVNLYLIKLLLNDEKNYVYYSIIVSEIIVSIFNFLL